MGIRNLMKFIKEFAPGAISDISLDEMKGWTIAIDISILVMAWCAIGVKEGKAEHVTNAYSLTTALIDKGITPVYVFDGKSPISKTATREKRAVAWGKYVDSMNERNKALSEYNEALGERSDDGGPIEDESIETSCSDVDEQLREDTVVYRKMDVGDCFMEVRSLLKLMKIPVVQASDEAEAQAVWLNVNGMVDAVATEDTDAIVLGGTRIIRGLTNSQNATIIDSTKVVEYSGLTVAQFIDLCILLGCDYTCTIPKIGYVWANKLIRQHGSIEQIIEHHLDGQTPDGFDYESARVEFNTPYVYEMTPMKFTVGILTEHELSALQAYLDKDANTWKYLGDNAYQPRQVPTQVSLEPFFHYIHAAIDTYTP